MLRSWGSRLQYKRSRSFVIDIEDDRAVADIKKFCAEAELAAAAAPEGTDDDVIAASQQSGDTVVDGGSLDSDSFEETQFVDAKSPENSFVDGGFCKEGAAFAKLPENPFADGGGICKGGAALAKSPENSLADGGSVGGSQIMQGASFATSPMDISDDLEATQIVGDEPLAKSSVDSFVDDGGCFQDTQIVGVGSFGGSEIMEGRSFEGSQIMEGTSFDEGSQIMEGTSFEGGSQIMEGKTVAKSTEGSFVDGGTGGSHEGSQIMEGTRTRCAKASEKSFIDGGSCEGSQPALAPS